MKKPIRRSIFSIRHSTATVGHQGPLKQKANEFPCYKPAGEKNKYKQNKDNYWKAHDTKDGKRIAFHGRDEVIRGLHSLGYGRSNSRVEKKKGENDREETENNNSRQNRFRVSRDARFLIFWTDWTI